MRRRRGVFRERKLAFLTVAAIVARAFFIYAHRIDSDEPQHLHVAWGWAHGLVQYRDLFDNHFPLLHMLAAPLMVVMPEGSEILWWMRIVVTAVAIGCAWLVFELGKELVGARAAVIAAITFSVLPPWLPKSVEFRNDTLWIFFWLATLLLVQRRRCFAAGVCAALCLLASVKALPLFIAHALVLVTRRERFEWRRFACGGLVPIVPAVGVFASLGAIDEMVRATLLFNAALPVAEIRRMGGAIAFVVLAPALARQKASHLSLFAVWYVVVMLCFWPHLTPRDFLPLVPLGALFLASRVEPITLFVVAVLAAAAYEPVWEPHPPRAAFIDAAVSVTKPDEYVYDLKGDAIFRRRPVYPIYDVVGRTLTGNGMLVDRAPEAIVARGCCAAIPDMSHIPARTRAFLKTHFIDRGAIRVCGAIPRDGTFTIAVPQTYAVLARDPSRVRIDGLPYRGPRFLAAGRHTIDTPEPRVTVIWAGALR